MTSRYMKVEGHSNLVRDKHTGAILNTNRGEIARSKLMKETKRRESEEIENLSKEVESLKSDISDIKNLLIQILRK